MDNRLMEAVSLDHILFFDLETEEKTGRIREIGALLGERTFHLSSLTHFAQFAREATCVCGHNILHHDLPALRKAGMEAAFFAKPPVDTLYLSALLFPEKPYHKLVKDYKLYDQYPPNNPVWDAQLAARLFADEVVQFFGLPPALRAIYYGLLAGTETFGGFFRAVGYRNAVTEAELPAQIRLHFAGSVCRHADVAGLIRRDPVALAYALALTTTRDPESVTPPWLVKHYPHLTAILYALRMRGCADPECGYCREWLDPHRALQSFFGYQQFRAFDPAETVSLQEQVVRATLDNQSLVAIFPTGGGKSVTFQLPALMTGRAGKALTVVISPLQSLMKDQVDVLRQRHGLVNAVTINGLLSPLERSEALERTLHGDVHLLYLSPEALRSRTITDLLKNRSVARFVIDEAHCFSSWGHDFRVDYLYIGEFIARLGREKGLAEPIPVSCFTATAKPQVVADIQAYFRDKLGLELRVFKAPAGRKNLTYSVQQTQGEPAKYGRLRTLVAGSDGPKIVYVSRVATAVKLAEKLTRDGLEALPYHGQMDSAEKIKNQDRFISGGVNTIVATTAFGMGVDKKDVEMVIHYEISDSLENYVQEAGRAGRSEDIQAGCYVLFDAEDLDNHFALLNHTRLNKKEIEQIWRGIRRLTGGRRQITRSALEIARAAGWDREMDELETRVKAAVAALEDGGYVKRGQNAPRIFANSFRERDVNAANELVRRSPFFSAKDREHAVRIIQRIVKEDETRVDYLAEVLAIHKEDVVRVLHLLRQAGVIGDAKDLTAFLDLSPAAHPVGRCARYARLERELLPILAAGRGRVFLKEVNGALADAGVEDASIDAIKDILLYWETRRFIHKSRTDRVLHAYEIQFRVEPEELARQMGRRLELARWIAGYLAARRESEPADPARPKSRLLEFSLLELKGAYELTPGLFAEPYELPDYEEALLYLNAISALKLEGGFLIIYTPLTVERLEADNRPYTKADYRKLETHYAHKVQQIHIVGEYARKMLANYQEALTFVDDYFTLDYEAFLKKYFPGRQGEIKRPLLPEKFRELFGNLSTEQLKIINDNVSGKILVTAGPGSGKTRVLVHKVASLLLLEDIKPEQFLMLTFSRAAALEFKERLRALVRGLVHYVDIHTYHGYCFGLLGRVGTLEKSDGIIETCLAAIRDGTIPEEKIAAKSVLVVDEFQDVNEQEFALLREIIRVAGDIRVIVVGDADQNIYEFRGASSAHLDDFAERYRATRYELRTNFRSRRNLVAFANGFLADIRSRPPKGEIVAHTAENGAIRLVTHDAPHLVAPLVADVKRLALSGTTAVLTPTNDAARLVEHGLRKSGVPARLILAAEGFCLADLLEIRHFTDRLRRDTPPETGRIPKETWDAARAATEATFAGSDKQWLGAAVIGQFEKSYPGKYFTEWQSYLREVRFEDFYYPEAGTVLVSTMHKAKGKEFDHVFLLLDSHPLRDDAARRAVYVALTRAKRTLVIHTNGTEFDGLAAENLEREHNPEVHAPQNEICLHLTHEDVYLGGFKHPKVAAAVDGLYAGQALPFGHDGRPLVRLPNGCRLRFSRNFEEKLAGHQWAGYRVTDVTVHFLVYWRDAEEDREYKVMLPRVTLTKGDRGKGDRRPEEGRSG